MDQPACRTLAFEYLPEQRCLVMVQGREAPSDAAWDAYVEQVRALAHIQRELKIFVATDGGRPTKAQQARLAEVASGHLSRVVVVSSVLAVRFVVSALSFIKPNLRFFAPDQLGEAFEHLAVAPEDRPLIEQTLERLRRRIRRAEPVRSPTRSG